MRSDHARGHVDRSRASGQVAASTKEDAQLSILLPQLGAVPAGRMMLCSKMISCALSNQWAALAFQILLRAITPKRSVDETFVCAMQQSMRATQHTHA